MTEKSTQSGGREETRGTFLLVVPWPLQYAGGVNQVVLNLARELKRDGGWRPLVLVSEWTAVRPRQVAEGDLDIIYFRTLTWPVFPDRRLRSILAYALWAPRFVVRMLRLIRLHRIKVINVHYPNASAFGFMLLKWLGVFRGKVILSFHGADIRGSDADPARARGFLRSMLGAADAVVACSRSLAAEVTERYPGCAGNVEVIENGVDPEHVRSELDTAKALPAGLDGQPFILTVSAFVPHKGQDVLLEAFRRVVSTNPELMLVMIGRGGPSLQALRMASEQLGLGDRVLMFPNLPHRDVLQYYRHARLFVLPSRIEPFGIVLLEAGLFALPVVATRVGGVPEVLGDDECGVIVPPEDPEAMSQAILRLLRDPEHARTAGQRFFTRVTTQFSWTRACARYLQLVRT